MIPSTVERVPQHTNDAINQRIRLQTEENVARFAAADSQDIEARLAELDREWDVERTLEANAATACLVGLALGATVSRKWFIFPGVVASFLLQHAVQGWCPPLPIFRRMGIRTASEIDYERYALKAIRGDFDRLRSQRPGNPAKNAAEAVKAAAT
ncbi:MAG: DUF2892 domain-containing protein [Pirellulales bacterium]|nr:DUF2892 domain-containing protein [Pirellulales bacterium]